MKFLIEKKKIKSNNEEKKIRIFIKVKGPTLLLTLYLLTH